MHRTPISCHVQFFDVIQNRGWNGERTFRLWVADDALRGVYMQDRGGWATGLSGVTPPEFGLPIVMVAGVTALLVASLVSAAAAIHRATTAERQQKGLKTYGEGKAPATAAGEIMHRRRMKAFDGRTDEFLGWDERNFRIAFDDIASVELHEKTRSWPIGKPECGLRLSLYSGQVIEWSLLQSTQKEALLQALTQTEDLASSGA